MAKKTTTQILNQEVVTPYEIHTLVNNWGGKIPPQMTYNYASKGYITTIVPKTPGSGVTIENALQWVWMYFEKKAIRESKKEVLQNA